MLEHLLDFSDLENANMALIGVRYDGVVTAALALSHATEKDIREFYRNMADTDRTVERTTIEDAIIRLQAPGYVAGPTQGLSYVAGSRGEGGIR